MNELLPFLFAGFAVLTLVSYVVLDGFDLGVGLIFPFARNEEERTLMMASIAPIWDGNETFLVLGAMVLLCGFPAAVSVILPALFVPMAIMLVGLVMRGVAFEFRAYAASAKTRTQDWMFAGGSLLMALGQGFALGAFVEGLPVSQGPAGLVFSGGPLSWLSPFSVLVGVCLTFGYGLLGSTWLIWKTDGSTQAFAIVVAPIALVATSASLLLVSAATLIFVPTAMGRWFSWPGTLSLIPIPLLALTGYFLTGRAIGRKPDRRPFFYSLILFAAAFAGLVSLLWPYAIPYSLTFEQAAAHTETLSLIASALVLILPFTYGYLFLQYRVFRGKTRLLHEEEAHGETAAEAIARRAVNAKSDAVTGQAERSAAQ